MINVINVQSLHPEINLNEPLFRDHQMYHQHETLAEKSQLRPGSLPSLMSGATNICINKIQEQHQLFKGDVLR